MKLVCLYTFAFIITLSSLIVHMSVFIILCVCVSVGAEQFQLPGPVQAGRSLPPAGSRGSGGGLCGGPPL